MFRLRECIQNKDRWSELNSFILLIEENEIANPNIALDSAKTLLESISKTILNDKSVSFDADSNLGWLVKQAFSSLPVFSKLGVEDVNSAKSILGSFENITRCVGEFRNTHGFFSHGQDLQSEKFDKYLVSLVISSVDVLSSFLIMSHAEDLKDRSRIYYEEHDEFNRYLDSTSEEYPVVQGIQLMPSRALFTDPIAYQDQLNEFVNEKNELISRFRNSGDFVSTRSVARDTLQIKEYFTNDELCEMVDCAISNPQIYRILGHGYTKNLFKWIYKEKTDLIGDERSKDLFQKLGSPMF